MLDQATLADNVWTGAVSIPANNANSNSNGAGCGATLFQLAQAVGYAGPQAAIFRLSGAQPGAVAPLQRAAAVRANPRPANPAVIATTDFTTHGSPIAAGADYVPMSTAQFSQDYWRSTDTNPVPVALEVVW